VIIAALVIYGVFGLVALGVRTLLHVRTTGRWPLLVPRSAAGWIGEGALTLGIFGSPAGAVLEPAFRNDFVGAIGLVALGTGVVGVIVAQAQMGHSWRAGVDPTERTELVTRGLFGWVRNPIYSSMVLAVLGMCLVVPNPVTIASTVLAAIGAEVVVRYVEEPYLSSVHGAAFTHYTARAGRFLPGVGRSPR
jgi:protein-S-isoprenylcysteine O-methyltransferase Ste14